MSSKNYRTIAIFIIVTFLGHGAIWQYMQHKINKQRQSLEEEKFELQKITETAKLRQTLNDIFYKITKLTKDYQEILKAKQQNDVKPNSLSEEQRIVLLNTELDQLINDFSSIEEKLAKIEERKPRNINLNFRPPPKPTGIGLEWE